MDIRWSAVLIGWLLDFSLSLLIQFIVSGIGIEVTAFFESPDLTRPSDLSLLTLLLLATGVGGYIAGRLARRSYTLNGFMVGIVGIIIAAFLSYGTPAPPRFFIVGQIAGCSLAALGGYVSSLHAR